MPGPTHPPSPMAIFNEALDMGTPSERAAYLDRACAGDADLRGRVEALLAVHDRAGDFLESPARMPASDAIPSVAVEEAGTIIGPYRLMEQIGEGGMGVVYVAEQQQPVRRKVALKVVKPGMDTRQVLARFEAERQALALMDHPNIATVLDAGATATGRSYFVMELIKGVSITSYCDSVRLPPRERLELFVAVCRAIQHAHQKGIIHRDIKPSNVLIATIDGRPVPKVIDFGVAKAIDRRPADQSMFTRHGTIIGTLEYMSPEQADLGALDIDTRSDIYSLGVLLYELLTGTTPLEKETVRRAAYSEILRQIRVEEPPRPSTRLGDSGTRLASLAALRRCEPGRLSRQVRGDLDWIVMKALDKDRARRYETANGFARDIERFLADEPVEAGPPSAWYRLRKLIRRNRVALTTTALVAPILVIGIVASAWQAGLAIQARNQALKAEDETGRHRLMARHRRYAADIRHAYQFIRDGEGPRALELLREWRPAAAEPDLREFVWHYLMRLCHDERRTFRGHKGSVFDARFSPDGRRLVTCGQDGTVRVWDVTTGRCLRVIIASDKEVNSVDLSPDGRALVTADDRGRVSLWDFPTGRHLATIPAHEGPAGAGFTPDGLRLVSAGRNDGRVRLWDYATRRPLATARGATRGIESGDRSSDGAALATGGGDGVIELWALAGLKSKGLLQTGYRGPVYGVAFSADSKRLAAVDGAGYLRVWELSGGVPGKLYEAHAHRDASQAVAFLLRDRVIATADNRASLRLHDAATGRPLGTLIGHTDKIWCIAGSPDGNTFVTTSLDGTARLWDARPPRAWKSIPGLKGPLAYTPDGRTLLVARVEGGSYVEAPDGRSAHWAGTNLEVDGYDPNTGTRRFRRTIEQGRSISGLHLSRDGGLLAVHRPDGSSTTWDLEDGRRLDTPGSFAGFAPGRALVVGLAPPVRPIELWDVAGGHIRRVLPGTVGSVAAAVAHGVPLIALRTYCVESSDELSIWDLTGNRPLCRRLVPRTQRAVTRFSPDATILALGDPRMVIELFDVRTLGRIDTLPGHADVVEDIEFSPDGRTLASIGRDGSLMLWDLAARDELLTLKGPTTARAPLRFAPDGRTLVFCSNTGGKDSICLLSTELPEDVAAEENP